MQIVFIAIVAIVIALIFSDGLGRDADVKLAIHQAEQQAKLDEEQRAILSRLEARKEAPVMEFVADWQRAYPTSSAERLQELRVIERRIEADPASAAQFTLAAHRVKDGKLGAGLETLSGKVELRSRPGL